MGTNQFILTKIPSYFYNTYPIDYNHRVSVYWTTNNPYDGVADWRSWLESSVGVEGESWIWGMTDIVPGDCEESTILTIGFKSDEHLVLFLLISECEVYNGNKSTYSD